MKTFNLQIGRDLWIGRDAFEQGKIGSQQHCKFAKQFESNREVSWPSRLRTQRSASAQAKTSAYQQHQPP